MTVLDALLQSLTRAGEYNRYDQVAPAVILWPDKERQWEPVEQLSIGWHPDLNDGVRLNIRPFMEADLSAAVPAGRQGQAGVLRKRPNIKWGKDRGKNPACAAPAGRPPGSPWGEDRDNDRHLTLEEKRRARET